MIALRKHTLAPLIPFLFFSLGTLASTLMLEAGAYSSEISQFGYPTGGWYRYVAYMAMSVLQYFLIFRIISPRAPNTLMTEGKERLFILLFAGTLAFYAVPVVYYGPAVLLALNRYEFMELPLVEFFNIKLYIAIMAFYLGLIATRVDSSHRRKAKTLFLVMIAVMLMYGEKFSGPVTALIFYYGGRWMAGKNDYVSLGLLLKMAIAVLVFLLAVYLLWGTLAGHKPDVIAIAFLDRTSRQGQVWWKLDEMVNVLGGASGKSVLDNLMYYSYSSSNPLGNQYVKSELMPADLYQLHSGSLSAVYPAILYFNNDFVTFLSYALGMNTLYWIGQLAIYFYSYRGFAIYALPATCAWYAVHLKIFQSGNIYLTTHVNYLIGLAFFLVLILYVRTRLLGRTLRPVSRPTT